MLNIRHYIYYNLTTSSIASLIIPIAIIAATGPTEDPNSV